MYLHIKPPLFYYFVEVALVITSRLVDIRCTIKQHATNAPVNNVVFIWRAKFSTFTITVNKTVYYVSIFFDYRVMIIEAFRFKYLYFFLKQFFQFSVHVVSFKRWHPNHFNQ